MSRDSKRHDSTDSAVSRRDVLRATGGAAALGALGTAATGTAAAAPTLDAALLADDIDLNLYWHDDQAWYDSTADETFHVYQSVDTGGSNTNEEDSDGDAYAVSYDHSDGSVTGPFRIGYNPLSNGDTHGVPSLAVDGDGYIHVFFGDHGGRNFQYARSENPRDVSSWIFPPDGSSGSGYLNQLPPGTYPSMTYDPGTDAVYVVYRAGSGGGGYPSHEHATLGKTTDNGVNWTDVNNGVIDLTDSQWTHADAYVSDLGAWQGRIHISWVIAESDNHGDPRRNVYHAAYNPSTGNMETMSGTDLGTEVSYSESINQCMVKDTTDIDVSSDGRSGSIYHFNHAYDPASDTAYIPVNYPVDSNTCQQVVMSYAGVSDGSGSWQESSQITTTTDPARLSSFVRVNDSGELEVVHIRGKDGLWRKENGTWNHYDYVSGTSEISKIQRPVQNGPDEFGWLGRDVGSLNGETYRIAYALGADGSQPAGAGATPTRAPKNLRDTNVSGTTVTIDWDSGLAGPSGVTKFKVYVDGTHVKDVTTTPPNMPYPRTWTDVDVGSGQHTIEVSLVNGNNTESATSNQITVDTGTTTDLNVVVDGTVQTIPESSISSYAGGQDAGTATVVENGDALNLTGNAWKDLPLDYTITSDTVLEFELETPDAGEVTAIGFDNDDDQGTDFNGSNSNFHLAGSQGVGGAMIDARSEYTGPGPQTVTLDVGSYFTGTADRMTFVGDDDADASSDIVYRNIEVYEDTGASGPTPVTHYAFDESSGASTATDSAGDDDATINGGVTAGVTGKDGTAFDFDGGSTATVEDGDAEAYINGLGAFSVAMWVQSDSTGNDRGLFNCVDDAGDGADSDVGMRYDSYGWESANSNCIKAAVRYDDGTGTVTKAQVETEGGVQTTNWQHVVYTWEAGDQVRIYLDGSEVTYGYSQSTPSGATIAQQDAFLVGGRVHTNAWDGKIDDVRVYDQALSASEVSSLYGSY